MSFLVDSSAPKYDNAGSRDGVIWCHMALWSGRTAPSSPRLQGSCTWSLQWPALGAILNAPFNVSKRLPGPSGLGWGWAGPGCPRGVCQGCPGVSRRVKIHEILDFPVDPCVPKYHHAESTKHVIWCQMALWGCLAATPSPRDPGFRTCTIR